MEIKLISKEKLLVLLSPVDLQKFELSFNSLDYESYKTRTVLNMLLKKAKEETGFEISQGKLIIEVFNQLDGSVQIIFTTVKTAENKRYMIKKFFSRPLIYEFENSESVFLAAEHINKLPNLGNLNSWLYLFKDKYRIAIKPSVKSYQLIKTTLLEYGRLVGEGDLSLAYTAEHGRLLSGKNALRTVTNRGKNLIQ